MSTQYACYESLLSDQVHWLSQSYGDGRAIAFKPRPECKSFRAALTKLYNLFANFDPHNRDAWQEYIEPSRFSRQHDVIYITMDQDRLHATLTNYFAANLPREMGKTIHTDSGEEGPDIDFVYNEAHVNETARQCATHFIDNHVEIQCFLRDESVVSHPELALGPDRHQPSAVCS